MENLQSVGELIRESRLKGKLKQTELVEGICSQPDLSRIERGKVDLSQVRIVYLLITKLGLDVAKVLGGGHYKNTSYADELFAQIESLKRHKDYENLRNLVASEIKTPLVQDSDDMKQFLLWHEGICMYNLDHDFAGANEMMLHALEMTNKHHKHYSDRECDILNSLSLIHYDEKQYDATVHHLEKSFYSLDKIRYPHNYKTKAKVFYSLSKVKTRLQQYDVSIQLCRQGMKWCKTYDTWYLFGEFHYHIGYNYMLKKEHGLAYKFYQKAINVFSLHGDDRYFPFISNEIAKFETMYAADKLEMMKLGDDLQF